MRKMILLMIPTLVLANFLNTFVQAQCVPPPSGMVAWFPFDENTGTMTENKMSLANKGTLNGATWSSGKVSNALNFQNSSVQVNNYPAINFGTGDFSIDAWIRLPNAQAGQGIKTIVDKRANNYIGYLFYVFNNKLALQLTQPPAGIGSNFQYYSTTTLPVGSWVHVTVTVDRDDPTGAGIRFYVNSVLAGTADPRNRPGNLNNSNPLRIGRQANGSFFNGGIDEVELFNRVLTPAEISSIFTADTFGKCKPATPTPPQPMATVSNNIVQNVSANTILPPTTDVYFVFEHPTTKSIIVAGWDQANFKNVVKTIAPNGTFSTITLPKCRGLYNLPAGVDLQMTVRSVTFGGDLIVTGQFDRCETFAGDPYPLGTPGIVKVKLNGQVDSNFNPDFYPAGSSGCQPVMPPANRKYCPPINFDAIQAFNGNNSVFLYGNFQSINGVSFTNPTNLIKLNSNNGQHDPTFTAPSILGTVKGISPQAPSGLFQLGVWGNFTVGTIRKNLMLLDGNGTISNGFNPGNIANINGTINTVGSEPVPIFRIAGGDFTKFKVSNYPLGSQSPVKNIVYTGEEFGSNTNGYRYFSWGSVTPFEIVSMDYAKGASTNVNVAGFCAGGSSLVCFTDGYEDLFLPLQNNRTPTVTPVTAVSGNVKVIFNLFGTNDFLVGGSFGLVKVTFTY